MSGDATSRGQSVPTDEDLIAEGKALAAHLRNVGEGSGLSARRFASIVDILDMVVEELSGDAKPHLTLGRSHFAYTLHRAHEQFHFSADGERFGRFMHKVATRAEALGSPGVALPKLNRPRLMVAGWYDAEGTIRGGKPLMDETLSIEAAIKARHPTPAFRARTLDEMALMLRQIHSELRGVTLPRLITRRGEELAEFFSDHETIWETPEGRRLRSLLDRFAALADRLGLPDWYPEPPDDWLQVALRTGRP